MIVFRTDASQKNGFGHITRSAYLASMLRSKCDVLFCINRDKNAARFLQEKKIPFCSIKEFERLKKNDITSIVFDLRHFSDEDIRMLERAKLSTKNPLKTVQITDLGLSRQVVDVTIDSSIVKLFPYDADESGAHHLLDGPDYAILHARFRHFNRIKRKYRKEIKNVFICFGGGVTYRRLRKIVELLSCHRYNIKLAPGFSLKKHNLKTLRRIYPGIRFVGDTDNLARSFFEADVALITTGVAAYEAAAAGTPALYVHYHDEQKSVAKSFENKNIGLEISNIDDLLDVDLIGKINQLTAEKRIDMGNNGKKLVDGKGVFRIIDFFERNKII
jgi:spore coat polysaccharide biosynthesis predicted glycosyltransferase SpsG